MAGAAAPWGSSGEMDGYLWRLERNRGLERDDSRGYFCIYTTYFWYTLVGSWMALAMVGMSHILMILLCGRSERSLRAANLGLLIQSCSVIREEEG